MDDRQLGKVLWLWVSLLLTVWLLSIYSEIFYLVSVSWPT
jgi:hypothetical protein